MLVKTLAQMHTYITYDPDTLQYEQDNVDEQYQHVDKNTNINISC